MTDKLAAIFAAVRIGDCITYKREGTLVAQRVDGWKLCNNGYEHRVLVGDTWQHDHEVALSTIVSRSRETGHDQGTVVF